MSGEEIIRTYPTKKKHIVAPMRYSVEILEKTRKMNNDQELLREYEKWINGINYLTDRKIKMRGKTHRTIGEKFMINDFQKFGHIEICHSFPFTDLKDIDIEKYSNETECIKNGIEKQNKEIDEYNLEVEQCIKAIDALQNWDDFICFDGKKYGMISKH